MNTYFELTVSFAISMALSIANQIDWQNDNPNAALPLWNGSHGLVIEDLLKQSQAILLPSVGKVEWGTIEDVLTVMVSEGRVQVGHSPHGGSDAVYSIRL